MGLAVAVVRVLAEDEDLHVRIRREVEGREHLVVDGVDGMLRPFGGDEALQLGPVRLGELRPQDRVPVGALGHRRPTVVGQLASALR